jgi:nuclear pore complex protein Nup107
LRLKAARVLRLQVPSDEIARSKTVDLLGEEYDLAGLEIDVEEEDITERIDGSAEQSRLLKRHMVAEAKSFSELELLIEALDLLEEISGCMEILRS